MKKHDETPALQGKTVVVLGASSGIGLATAQAASANGARVIIVSGNQSRITQALQTLGPNSAAYTVDLGNEQAIKTFFNELGNFDHLVYTAGENISLGLISDTDVNNAKDYFTIRYWGAVAAVKYSAPLINAGGSITLTSGIAAQRPGKGWWLGSSITSAMEGFARAMAIELAPIRVNIVSPGVVRTNLWNSMSDAERDGFYQSISSMLPVQRVGEACDIAQAFLYLIQQPFSTGQVIVVDGGGVLV